MPRGPDEVLELRGNDSAPPLRRLSGMVGLRPHRGMSGWSRLTSTRQAHLAVSLPLDFHGGLAITSWFVAPSCACLPFGLSTDLRSPTVLTARASHFWSFLVVLDGMPTTSAALVVWPLGQVDSWSLSSRVAPERRRYRPLRSRSPQV